MSQVFSADAVNNTASTTVTTTSETTGAVGNFVNPPFQTAKCFIEAMIALLVGASTTTVTIRIRRNPNAENLVVASVAGVNVTAANTVVLSLQAADAIPDGRPVQYAVTVQQAGATGNGTINFANVALTLISG